MNPFIEFLKWLKNWAYLIAFSSLIIGIINYIIRKAVINRLIENDIKTLKKSQSRQEDKEEKILERVIKLEKEFGIRKNICQERHGK